MRLPRPSYPAVASSLALFISLGGTSYAVATLPRNSVGGSQLKKDAVTSEKVKDGSIAASDLAADARASALPGVRGPRGAEGPQGPQGATGAAGANGRNSIPKAYVARRRDARAIAGTSTVVLSLSLPAGRYSVHAMTQLYAPGAVSTVDCYLVARGEQATWTTAQMGTNPDAALVQNVAMSDAIELTAAGAISFECVQRYNAGIPVSAFGSTLEALPVDAIEVQPG